MAGNIQNLQKIHGCLNGYTTESFTNNFFVNEEESKICSGCNHFCYTDGIATCSLITNISESNKSFESDNVIME